MIDLAPAKKRLSDGRNAHVLIAPTDWWFSTYYFDENIAAGSTIAIISAVDEDQSDTQTFALIDGYAESSGNSNFYIEGNKLKIKTAKFS